LNRTNGTIQFGGYTEADFRNSSYDLQWFTIEQDSWTIPCNNILYNNNSCDVSFESHLRFDTTYDGIEVS